MNAYEKFASHWEAIVDSENVAKCLTKIEGGDECDYEPASILETYLRETLEREKDEHSYDSENLAHSPGDHLVALYFLLKKVKRLESDLEYFTDPSNHDSPRD